ncbi:acyl-CoA thioesterase [Sphingobacterium athyrii]|uniref:4-hydroxybenzoyl-CoA thioesterase n=1 Tax=Sphingobacterium athyrii TaxID=2152717 RepID=A0A363NVQ2_9SPHI|nr:acyl-CoA thioesterase [Sphingobacterium athyrii]PUV24874.1 4-hydroxybenzoyl-CoA thioesterase [Sphingobacterium athyrii]
MAKNKLPEPASQVSWTSPLHIRFNEVDSLGIVWHGHYISYFEDGRESFGIEHGLTYLDIHQQGYTTPIVKSTCEHKLPLRYGEHARIETSLVDCKAAKIIYRYRILNDDNQIVCLGETIQVFLDADGNLQLYLPEFFQQWKNSLHFSNR